MTEFEKALVNEILGEVRVLLAAHLEMFHDKDKYEKYKSTAKKSSERIMLLGEILNEQ